MSEFRTEVVPVLLMQKLSYADSMLLIGSCFSENMGRKFDHFGFDTLTNPFGVIFNPISIVNLLQRSLDSRMYTESDLHFDQGRWFCFETHGDMTALTKEECLKKHNLALDKAFEFLKKTNCLIITLGSAWVYEHIDLKYIVANCHKVPNKNFTKRLLSIEEVIRSFQQLIKSFELETLNVKLLFTISPVRHLKDGVVENQRSKSILHLVIQQLVDKFEMVDYFPAYEIMMDDLRDYRFYNQDMLHPNQQAVDYIWEKFRESSIDNSCLELMERVDKLRNGLGHRPFNEDDEKHKKFKAKLITEVKLVKQLLPSIEL
ncbi:MAG: GSCFA domain-containing protein [Flavobacteriales bacterium]|nr:GSCFA domain-containing protein [Flavobacteriales bacterium]